MSLTLRNLNNLHKTSRERERFHKENGESMISSCNKSSIYSYLHKTLKNPRVWGGAVKWMLWTASFDLPDEIPFGPSSLVMDM